MSPRGGGPPLQTRPVRVSRRPNAEGLTAPPEQTPLLAQLDAAQQPLLVSLRRARSPARGQIFGTWPVFWEKLPRVCLILSTRLELARASDARSLGRSRRVRDSGVLRTLCVFDGRLRAERGLRRRDRARRRARGTPVLDHPRLSFAAKRDARRKTSTPDLSLSEELGKKGALLFGSF